MKNIIFGQDWSPENLVRISKEDRNWIAEQLEIMAKLEKSPYSDAILNGLYRFRWCNEPLVPASPWPSEWRDAWKAQVEKSKKRALINE
jgi:hypothetical protein